MDDTLEGPAAPTLGRKVRLLVKVRWGLVIFAFGHVLAYDMEPYPPGVLAVAVAFVSVLAVGNILLHVLSRRARATVQVNRLAFAALALDAIVVAAITYLYSFDAVSAIFTLLFLVPIEGALYFQLRGAMASWAVVATLYTGREVFATRWGNPFEWTSLTFRVGMLGLVAVAVGLVTRQLAVEHQRSLRALAELQRVERWRARMVATLGHDLRSPLATISGLAATTAARAPQLTVEQVRDLADRIVAQADGLVALSTDLLDLSRHESGDLVLERRMVPVADLVAAAAESAGHRDETTIDVPPGLAIFADPARLGQVLVNLVANAHRHGSAPVRVTGAALGSETVLSVRDHGPGVPKDLAMALFDPYAHGDGDRSVGLGLWIAHALVTAHGGEITHRGAEPGAEFTVRLPTAPDQ